MFGLKQVYKLNKNLPFYKCKDLMNNAKFALVVDTEKECATMFTTLRRNKAQKQVMSFLKYLESKPKGIRKSNYFIILDNI